MARAAKNKSECISECLVRIATSPCKEELGIPQRGLRLHKPPTLWRTAFLGCKHRCDVQKLIAKNPSRLRKRTVRIVDKVHLSWCRG